MGKSETELTSWFRSVVRKLKRKFPFVEFAESVLELLSVTVEMEDTQLHYKIVVWKILTYFVVMKGICW